METVKAVRPQEPDPKAGKPRAKSGVSFPYWDLNSAVEVAKVMHDRAGGVCDNTQLAPLLGYSGVSNGSYRTRVSSAKMFGLIEDTEDRRLRVSARGRAIVAPVNSTDERNARVAAFLSVELFKRVFDEYNGATLPENVGLRNLLQQYQVVPDRIAPTVRILLDSAEQAGLFEVAGNRTRMVMPVGGVTPAPSTQPPPPPPADVPPPRTQFGGGSGGGGGNDGTDIDPAILGLLKRLPPGGTPMSHKRRTALIAAFTNVVGFIYPDADDGEP